MRLQHLFCSTKTKLKCPFKSMGKRWTALSLRNGMAFRPPPAFSVRCLSVYKSNSLYNECCYFAVFMTGSVQFRMAVFSVVGNVKTPHTLMGSLLPHPCSQTQSWKKNNPKNSGQYVLLELEYLNSETETDTKTQFCESSPKVN